MVKNKILRLTVLAMLSTLSLVVWHKASARSGDSDITFQQSQSVSVTMGVRDKYGSLGGYKALFVIRDGKGNQIEKLVFSNKDNAADMIYPADIDRFPTKWAFDGSYTWTCKVNQHVVARGKFIISNTTHTEQVRAIDPF